MHTHKHTSEIMNFLNPLIYSTVILYSATVWQQMDSLAVLSLKKKVMENKNIYNIMEKQ